MMLGSRCYQLLGLVSLWMLAACGDGRPEIKPPLDGFVLAPAEQQALDAAAMNGRGAQGSYTFDESSGTIVVTITVSTFSCGIEPGPLMATILERTPTRMLWQFPDGTAEWTRIDAGTEGIVGVWKSVGSPVLYLVLTADGKATIVGEEVCAEARPKNGESCEQLSASARAITIDGSLADWDGVEAAASIADPQGDYVGMDPGADLRALKIALDGGGLYLLTELYGAPSTNFQGRGEPYGGVYRLEVHDTTGTRLFARLSYSEGGAWQLLEPSDGSVRFGVGAQGIEWWIDRGRLAGGTVSLVRAEALDCGTPGQPCQTLDETDACGFFPLP